LETKVTKYFNKLIKKNIIFFSNVNYKIDITPIRAILKINANYKNYRVFITELLSKDYRKYNFYLLKKNYVIVGFDNSQDARAIKLKFKKKPKNKFNLLVPHQHLKNKTILKLTDEIFLEDFIDWIKKNVI